MSMQALVWCDWLIKIINRSRQIFLWILKMATTIKWFQRFCSFRLPKYITVASLAHSISVQGAVSNVRYMTLVTYISIDSFTYVSRSGGLLWHAGPIHWMFLNSNHKYVGLWVLHYIKPDKTRQCYVDLLSVFHDASNSIGSK